MKKNTKTVEDIRPDWNQPNYDKSKITPYTLEDPLTFANGKKLKSAAEWPKRRREILDIFAREMFGQEPPAPDCLVTELVEERRNALAGFAVRSLYQMWFKADKSGPCINWVVYRPRHAKKPVPVILFLNYNGNAELTPDTEIPLMTAWCRNDENASEHRIHADIRGKMCDPNRDTVLPLGMILARGYAVMSACYCEMSPDPDPDFNEPNPLYKQETCALQYGLFTLWRPRDESRDDNTTALGAWAWGLSRGLDLAERIPELDATRPVVTGCSRLGKAAFLAAARDERFKVCVPVQCGGGGVTLAKRDYGENVGIEVAYFKHWYCKAYKKYERNPAKLLTFDQHLLLAAIAPRHVLVEGFISNPWFDTEGEFLACQAAAPAWKFLGKPGLPTDKWPEPYEETAIGSHIGYVMRTEAHGIAACDWSWLLDFADQAYQRHGLF